MYVGRFVVVGRTDAGAWYLGYRVSSRSFPNRRIIVAEDRAMVVPRPEAVASDNPYISYNCLRMHGGITVVANGSHVDPIIDKIAIGYPLRDAMALSMLALDYEHDQYNTPRITAALDGPRGEGYLGIVAEDRLFVQRVPITEGRASMLATYERTEPTPIVLEGDSAEALCEAMMCSEYEHPVTSLVAMLRDGELETAAQSVR